MAVRFVTLLLAIAAGLNAAVAELSIKSREPLGLTLHGATPGVRLQFMDDVHPLGVAIADAQGAVVFSVTGLNPGPHAIRAVEWGTGKSVSAPILFTIPAQPATFAASVTYATGIQPAAMVSADLTRDGFPDLVFCATSATGAGSIKRLRNHGGTFSAPENLAAVAGPVDIVVQDFNGDGRNDLAVASADGRVAILLNGVSGFSRVRYFAAGSHAAALVSADFNGDGIPDLALTNQDDNTVSILLGNGDGSFQAAITRPAGYSPRGLVAADFNGDGLVDLAIANFQGNDLSILLGDGRGGFRNAGNVPVGNGPVDIAVADFNEDGSPDLAVMNQLDGTVMVLANNGSGAFQLLSTVPNVGPGAGSMRVGDINGDGHADLVLQTGDGAVRVRNGFGDGGFVEGNPIAAGAAPRLLTLGDFNGDRRLDIGAVDFGGTLTVIPSEAPSSVSSLGTTTPFIYIDSLPSGSTVSGTVTISGWAIDSNTAIGPLIGGVQILVDGTVVGSATYGIARADVCTVYPGRQGCPNVGFTYQLNTAGLSAGLHTITALASDTSSPVVTGSYSLTVTVPSLPAPFVYVDSVASGATVSGTINLSGWAINNITTIGAAVGTVRIAVDGALVGNANYGSARADVCTVFPGRAGCPNVGFSYPLNTTTLSAGVHTVTATATDVAGSKGSYSLTITLTHAAAPAITPANPVVRQGTTQVFTADQPVTWSLASGSVGSLDPDGTYHAPSSVATQQQVAGCPLLPSDNIYNTRIDAAPKAACSDTWLLGAAHVGCTNTYGALPSYTVVVSPEIPHNIVDNSTPTIAPVFFYGGISGDYAYPSYPYLKRESGYFTSPLADNDRHVITVNKQTCDLGEMYNNYTPGTNPGCALCTAQSGVRYNSLSYNLSTVGSTSASGMYLEPLLPKLAEVRQGAINHALMMTLSNSWLATPNSNPWYVWPATVGAAGFGTIPIPYGSRFRLKSTFDITGFSTTAQVFLLALQRYGAFAIDGGLSFNLISQTDLSVDNSVMTAIGEIAGSLLRSTDFEIVDESTLMTSAASGLVNQSNSYIHPSFATVIARSATGTSSVPVALQGVTVGVPDPSIWIQSGVTTTISAWVNGSDITTYTCSMSPSFGNLSGCTYTAPAVSSPTTTTITVAATADPTATSTIAVTVMPAGAIRIAVGRNSDYTADDGITKWWKDQGREQTAPVWTDNSYLPQNPWPQGYPNIGLWYHNSYSFGDVQYKFQVPNGTYQVTWLTGIAGIGTFPPGNSQEYLESKGVKTAVFDPYDVTGGVKSQPGTGTYNISVSDGLIDFTVRRYTVAGAGATPYPIVLSGFSIEPVGK